ncbi:hypothetical protein GOBAR_DD01786 [Gossypium barbadense]|nr:hypothetical protein GOBAR_DD01786 [Gossypium barbadense]
MELKSIMVLISYVDSQSIVCGIGIDLNAAPETNVVSDGGYNSSNPSDHEANSDSHLDVDEVPNDINDEGVNDDGNVNASSVGNQIRRIVIHNNPGAHMLFMDPIAAYTVEVLEYPKILPAHRMVVDSNLEELFVGQRFESKEEWVFSIKQYIMNISMDYKVTMSRLTLYIKEYWRSAKGCNWFQTLHYPCAHVMETCAKVSLNVEQIIDEVYTLEHTLRVWENEFSILPDLSTWEVPPMTFELIPNKGLRRNLKGRPQSSRIHNEMDIKEKFNGKLYGVCRLDGHIQNEKSYASNAIDELELKEVEYCGGYGLGGVENSHRPPSLDDKNYPPGVAPTMALALARVQEVDVEEDRKVAQVVSCVGGLLSTVHQTKMVSPSQSTTLCTLTRAAYPKHDLSECRDILYAIELPEYSITMIPLHCLEIDNGCVNAP